MTPLILGSQSPRRIEIMSQFKLPFKQVTSQFIEEEVLYSGNPQEYALTLSIGKSRALVKNYAKDIILTADTVVYCKGKIYNKPQTVAEAKEFLTTFSQSWQSVLTGVTVRRGQEEYSACEETRVLFNSLTSSQIARFLEVISWQDKGGGYTIQGIGSLLINKIEGCYYNVTGLPVNTVRKLLLKLNVDLWNFL